jgi:hypothetical protein
MRNNGLGCAIALLIFVAAMLILGLLGFAANGFSTACKPPMHTHVVGNSQVCS